MAPLAKQHAPAPTPTVRPLHFALPPERAFDWHALGPHVTAFDNTLSIFFPLGERFFIRAVRAHQHLVPSTSPLSNDVTAFISQEAFHTREHESYNDALRPRLPVALLEAVLGAIFWLFERLSSALCLSATVGLEHLTSTLGATLLANEADTLAACEPHFAALWRWHALEECEHKAVAFDVFELAYGRGVGAYALRMVGFIIAQLIFAVLFVPLFLFAVCRSGALFDAAGWRALFAHHWAGEGKGILRRMGAVYRAFFRMSFHPSDHDNHGDLAREAKRFAAAAAPSVKSAGKPRSVSRGAKRA